jgi:hypothetical protein
VRDLIALRLMRTILWHIQSEQSPIYRAAWRPSRFQLPISWIYLLLLLSIPLLRLFEIGSGVPFFVYRDQALVVVALFGIALISFAPYGMLAALTAAGIARQRLAQTWDMFLLTPAEPYEVITATAAAALRPQWRAVLGGLLLGALFGVGAAAAGALGLAAGGAWLWAISLLGASALVPYIRLQEAALSVLLGVRLSAMAPRSAFVLGMMLGMALRLVTPVLAILLSGQAEGLAALSTELVRLSDVLPSNAPLIAAALVIGMALLSGELALIAFAPSPFSVLLALLLIGARAWLVRQLALREEAR